LQESLDVGDNDVAVIETIFEEAVASMGVTKGKQTALLNLRVRESFE
jgi:hypothetical protein